MAIPLELRGIDISLVQLTLQTINATTGVLADSTTIATITAVLAAGAVDPRMEHEEISAITSTRKNNVPLQADFDIMLRELLQRQASALPSTGPILPKVASLSLDPTASTIWRIQITRGNNSWQGYGSFAGLSEGPYGRGANFAEARFVCVDNGSSSLTYT